MMNQKKRITIGILAHVDAGKTTLSEAMLYLSGSIRTLGRVDHKDAFLDTDVQERERGITIFSKQARFQLPKGTEVTLLDTPGHVDFSAEMERTLRVLDYAILVISGKDGVQSHTVTLWKLLQRYHVPAFIFINKMDLDGVDRDGLLGELKSSLDSGCCSMDEQEEIATCDEALLEEYLEQSQISCQSMANAIRSRKLFPCYFGSALKLNGVEQVMEALDDLTLDDDHMDPGNISIEGKFSGRIFKITRDDQGERLTHMRILDGCLQVKDEIGGEKVNQIRLYSGDKFQTVEQAERGMICAVTGLASTSAGYDALLEPVLSYRVIVPEGVDDHKMMDMLKQLEDEDPQLHVTWNQQNREILVRLMGEIQLEVLKNLIAKRFHIEVEFGEGKITYKETISEPVECAGHFEPLRHYSEVHLLLEPLPEGSGMAFASACSEDDLDKNWQRLIMTHFMEKEHTGALTNSPVTDIRITILGGKAHQKHTEGGDFRQSTYRAIRQGLRKSAAAGKAVLLEPWYEFRLEVPSEFLGRAMSDIQRMGGTFQAPQNYKDYSILEGEAPVSEMKNYITDVAMYTKGYGRLLCTASGYKPCHNQEAVVSEIAYDPDRDPENTGDSVFCQHGAGYQVPWDESDGWMHVSVSLLDAGNEAESETIPERQPHSGRGRSAATGSADFENDEELKQIFAKTYGGGAANPGSRKKWKSKVEPKEYIAPKRYQGENLPEYLIVDGYNIIFAWPELKELAKVNIDSARDALIEIICNYQGYRKCKVMVVFDAYKVSGGTHHVEKQGDVTIVYTKEAETADTFIERTTFELAGKGVEEDGKKQKYRVRVATSDRLEQMIVAGNDAHRISAKEFKSEVENIDSEIQEEIRRNNRKNELNKVKLGHIIDKKQ